ncbi:restriction endonuclease subunit S [Bacteroides cellulosilyticus]|uniref:restriction endonuclease subunit S n=1 Tax=Bacteroides cellulosilyticus TaxID=246787 RepID=UPI001CC9F4BF|nr:restriction endonuclease subunit S [Bacteroides cellulosilyticus]UBD69532.1 restriction endonuclease subunit S [Bacteroides cellulosilyticus]
MAEPIIRFRNNHSDWDRFVIDDVFELRNGYTPSKNVNQYWENGVIPWFRMEDIRANGGILSDSIQHITPQAVKGGGLFVPYSIILATTATIGVHAMVIADSLANQRFTNFSIRKSLIDKYDSYFIYYAFYKIDEWSLKNTNSGGLLSVDIKGLLKQPFLTPSKTEQQQIASYFKSLDVLIQSVTKKIASLKQLKSASLISMFPQAGETKPRVRFKGFEEVWKTVPFDIVFRYLKSNTLSRADLNETLGSARNIHYGDILIKFGTLIDIRKDDLPYITNHFLANQLTNNCKLQKGDIIFADAAEDSTVGKCTEIAFIGEEKVVAGLHTIPCRTLFEFSEGYLGFYLNSPSYHNQLLPLMQGTKISSISKSALLNTSISFPSNIAEQCQIASFFCSLDTQISLETQRLDKLKQIKSACLDKMFV